MKNREANKEKCEFTVHPCNFKVIIKKVKPFYVYSCDYLVLDLQVINHCNAANCIRIKSKPRYGKLYFLGPSTLIYKSTKNFTGFDIFQMQIENEYGGMRTENILIRVIN